jgi:sortase A
MALYVYLKSSPKEKKEKKVALFWHFLPLSLIVLGLVFMGNAVLPLAFYEIKKTYFQPKLSSPLVLGEDSTPNSSYANPRNWFPVLPQLPPRPSKITHYSLSIPKLGVRGAVVQVGGEDLMESLVQYPGTALPGQLGNTVIFGHSVLPQFFNPENYKSIFSTLPNLEEGDEVLVEFDGVFYRYQVTELAETSPKDLTLLEQRYNDSYLTLVTCVPPGTYLRRLAVRAKLAS